MFYHPAAVLPHMKSGRLRALGVSGLQRSAAAPEVVPIAEQGYSDFDLVAWFMLYAPAGTPDPVVARLREAAAAALASDEVKGKLLAQGVEQRAMKPAELADFNRAEVAKWSDLVKRSGAQVD
jgi:tripartite-type tricarboxylate transporter receptor subunit TctC